MLALAKKEEAAPKAAKASGDFVGRFGAWWDGRDYVPPPPADGDAQAAEEPAAKKAKAKPEKEPKPEKEAKAEAKPDKKPEKKADKKVEKQPEEKPAVAEAKAGPGPEAFDATTPSQTAPADMVAVRIKALETLWGDGRLMPGSFSLDTMLLDAVLEHADKPGDIGFLGADAALLNAFAAQSDRKARAAEWRTDCLEHLKALAPGAEVSICDLDRPKVFGEGALEGLVTIEAFAYADHKAGMVSRAWRSLSETGRWVFLDTTRTTKKTPPAAFASAWAEPQLATADDVEELLKLAGFAACKKVSVTAQVLDAARLGYAQLSQTLEQAATGGLTGREGALFLQELAWEAQTWRARMRALEGGALEVNLWIADKTAPLELTTSVDQVLDTPILPDDAGASDALFDKA